MIFVHARLFPAFAITGSSVCAAPRAMQLNANNNARLPQAGD